jgi:hypothetical protein
MIGAQTTVTIDHLTTTRDSHGGKAEGEPDATIAEVPATIARASTIDGLYKITVEGDHSAIAKAPAEWRLTDPRGNVYAPSRATYRPPVGRIAGTEHTLLFAELQGEIIEGVV